jgi:hypothetical protein
VSNTPGLISSISLSATVRPAAHVLGVRAGGWHAIVNERGSIRMEEQPTPLDWYVAADDRWHNPAKETTVRQTRRAGVPIIETRVRIPSGDAVQRVYAVPDHGGLLVVEISNESTLPIAVAFTRPDVLSSRQPSPLGPQGIDLPEGSVVFPVAHGSTLRVALASHKAVGGTVNLEQLPTSEQLQRGWLNSVERAGYALVADKSLAPLINRLRSDLLVLSGNHESEWGADLVGTDADDDVAYLLSLHELVRMGEKVEHHLERVVDVVEALFRKHKKATSLAWDVERALFAARCVLWSLDEHRAADDVRVSQQRLAPADALPNAAPKDVRVVAWLDEQLVSPRREGGAAVLRFGVPRMWLGVNMECHRIVASPEHKVSYGLRWHGEKPAVLWETSGPFGLRLDAGATDAAWHSVDATGDALLAGFVAP